MAEDTVCRIPTTSVETHSLKMKQGIETTQADQTSDESIDTEDLKINVSKINNCSMSMTGVQTVPQTGLCGESEKKYDKAESSCHKLCNITVSQIDSKKEIMANLNSFQHSQLVQPDSNSEKLSEQIRNSVERPEDVMMDGTRTGRKPYKCDICGLAFGKTSNLKAHIMTHTGEKPYKCDICDVGFRCYSALRRHIRTHTQEKPYKCDFCDVGFSDRSTLKRHIRTHTGEKPYECDICGVGFSQCSTLKVHKRTHTGEKPYKCDICSLGFSKNCHMKTHRRTHTGEKSYKCDICGIGFSQNFSLKRHKRTHT